MAIKIYEQFAPFANPADGDHPYGSIKNDSIPGAEDGTPLDAVWANDLVGFTDALLAEAGVVPSGQPDKLGASQRVEAIKLLEKEASKITNANGGTVQDHINDYQVHTRTFANVDAMLAFNGLVVGQRYSTGGTTWEYFGGGNTIDKFKPITHVYVTDFGADNTGEVDSAAVIHYVCSIFDDVYFPTGIYIHEVTLKPIGRNNQRLEFEEGAVLKHTGVGVAVQFGRDDQSARYDCKFINPFIIGNSNTTDGLLWQALSHCYAETINVRDCNGAGIRLLWGVDNIFDGYNISSNEGVFNVTPTYGVRIGRTIVGNYSVGNIFLNAVIEGVSSDGIWIEEGNHNQFIGGTSEVNGSGYTISDISFGNEFKNVWCEGNTNYDVNDLGIGTVIDNCYNGSNSPSQANVIANGSGLIVTKGWCRHIDLSTISRDTRLENVRFSDNPSLGIQGTGTKQIRGCLKADVNGNITGTYPNETGSSGTFTPTMQGGAVAGANTYSVQKGTWTREGNEVHYNIDIEIAAKDAAMTGGVIIGPFPFQAASLGMSQAACVGYHSLVSTTGGRDNITAEMLDANLYLQLWGCQAGASASVIDSSGIVNGTRIKISGFYEVQ